MAKSPINTRLEKAVALHQAGRLAEAERLYDQILALDRVNPDALNLKGAIANIQGRRAEALALFDRAIAALPNFPDARFNRGLVLAALGRNDEALQSYLDALALKPNYTDARLNAGLLLHIVGRTAEAISAFRLMTQMAPADPRGFYNLGVCLEQSLPKTPEAERPAIASEARAALTRAATLAPHNPDVHFAFANLQSFLGEYKDAIARLKATLALRPDATTDFRAETLSNIGEYLRKDKQFADAIAVQREALTLRPDDKIIRFNLATALGDNLESEEARVIYEGLIKSDPGFAKPYVNLANIHRDENRPDEALALLDDSLLLETSRHALSTMAAIFTEKGWLNTALLLHDKAVSLKSDDVSTRFFRSISLLMTGRLTAGWPDYDLRFEIPSEMVPGRPSPPSFWQGEDLTGKKLFIWTEQGIGDEALYAGMIPEMIARAGSCVIESSERMVPVFARSFPQAKVVPRVGLAEALAEAARADVQISVGSLGRYLRRDFASFPKHEGYLKADPDKTARLRRKYEEIARGRRIVGVAWKSRRRVYGKSKSTTPSDLGAILEVPGTLFVNLQYGDCAEEIKAAKEKFGVEIHQDPEIDALTDIDGFFALVAAMDLVISTSNSAAHVAGALNIPTWLLLPHGRGALWYWFLQREDSPWYPSMKIFRATGAVMGQPWEIDAVSRAGAQLAQWVRGQG